VGPMSEFKFACPVCGQHITAESSSGGTEIQCPTCFQKIIVPQAPVDGSTKLILSAAQVAKPRLPGFDTSSNLGAKRRISRPLSSSLVALLIVLLCGGAALFLWAEEISKFPSKQKTVLPQKVAYPVPTHISWTMDLTNAAIPEETVVGSLDGSGFVCERAIL